MLQLGVNIERRSREVLFTSGSKVRINKLKKRFVLKYETRYITEEYF